MARPPRSDWRLARHPVDEDDPTRPHGAAPAVRLAASSRRLRERDLFLEVV